MERCCIACNYFDLTICQKYVCLARIAMGKRNILKATYQSQKGIVSFFHLMMRNDNYSIRFLILSGSVHKSTAILLFGKRDCKSILNWLKKAIAMILLAVII
jgi:hypothetical protein